MADIIIVQRKLIDPRLERIAVIAVNHHIFRHVFKLQPSARALVQCFLHIVFKLGKTLVQHFVEVSGGIIRKISTPVHEQVRQHEQERYADQYRPHVLAEKAFPAFYQFLFQCCHITCYS